VLRYDNGLTPTSARRTVPFGPGQSDVTFNFFGNPGRIFGADFISVGSAQPWVLADPARPGNIYVIVAQGDDINSVSSHIRIARSTEFGAHWTQSFVDVGAPIGGSGPLSFQLFPTAAIDQQGTPAAPTTALASPNVKVGNQGSLQGIQGVVKIFNHDAAQFAPFQNLPRLVTVDDSQDTQVRSNVIIGANRITGLNAPIILTTGSVGTLIYNGGVSSTGHNSDTIAATPDTQTLMLSAPGSGDIVNVQSTAAGTTTTIQGGNGGNHIFNVGSTTDKTSTLDAIQGLVNVVSGNASDTLTIDDQGSTTPHTYTITQNSPTDTFTRSAPGTPTVTIMFSSSIHLNPEDGPKAGATAMAAELAFPTTIAAGHPVTMSGQLEGTGELSLSVDWGDGSPAQQITPDQSPFRMKHKYTQPGTYHVRVVWTDSSGQSGFREMTIVVTAGDGSDD
jgi:hypothetical protein